MLVKIKMNKTNDWILYDLKFNNPEFFLLFIKQSFKFYLKTIKAKLQLP